MDLLALSIPSSVFLFDVFDDSFMHVLSTWHHYRQYLERKTGNVRRKI